MSGRAGRAVSCDARALAREVAELTGGEIRLALPLGLGKAVTLANAFVELALEDPSISLSIFTALTLEVPHPADEMSRRLLGPASERLFGRYPGLRYAELQHRNALPENITINEFFFLAGKWLGNRAAQQNHICANYTHALGYLLDQRPNVVAQLLARSADGRLSLSCNTDITLDLLAARREGRADFVMLGEINSQLPFMPGPAEIETDELLVLFDDPKSDFELFSAPSRPVSLADHAIGLHVSRLIADGGTVQIGIGSTGDAIAHALLLRHRETDAHAALLNACPFDIPDWFAGGGPFAEGLYCVTEMLVAGLLALFEAGVIRREEDGAAIHAGFFVESRDFYEKLRAMPADRLARIAMMPVSYTNSLYGDAYADEGTKRVARRNARFVNSAMMATLLGAAISDTREDGQVVSGVGGQFNFVDQAFALEGARSIITLPATRSRAGKTSSNIVWSRPFATVPRHMRDIVVTEYGIADLRGKSEAETIRAMLRITDSRFQEGLREEACKAGKLPRGWAIPESWKANRPERLEAWLAPAREDGHLPTFPLGTDFTPVEQRLLPALDHLREIAGARWQMAALAWRGLFAKPNAGQAARLKRMDLDKPSSMKERALRAVLLGAMKATGGQARGVQV